MVEPMIATTPMVFSSHCGRGLGAAQVQPPGSMGTKRGSTCQ